MHELLSDCMIHTVFVTVVSLSVGVVPLLALGKNRVKARGAAARVSLHTAAEEAGMIA